MKKLLAVGINAPSGCVSDGSWPNTTQTTNAIRTITSSPSLTAGSHDTSVAGIAMPVTGGNQAAGLSLSLASEPFPQKVVDKVRSGNFVEMLELLTNNITLLQQLEVFHSQCSSPSLPGVLRPWLQEVTSLPSWVYCFLACIVIKTPNQTTRDLLTYLRLVIREAQRHDGRGWLDYDRVFRQQAAIDRSLQWTSLQPGIQAATILGHGPSRGMFCTLCHEPDRLAELCALSYLQESSSQPLRGSVSRQHQATRPS